jgi:hypothetical protein
VELEVEQADGPMSTLRGFAVADTSSLTPVAGAEVWMPGLARSARTERDGSFVIHAIPPGEHEVVVRRPGYGALAVTLQFEPGRALDRRVVLPRLTSLDAVTIVGERRDPRLQAFDEHRNLGLGHFFTRSDLERREGVSMGAIMAEVPSLRVASGRAGQAWIATSRGPRSLSGKGITFGSEEDHLAGSKPACYVDVYIDGVRLYPPGRLIDLNAMSPAQVEAVEYYAGPSQLPLEYQRLDACGALVIHTRRFDRSPDAKANGLAWF